MCRSEHKFQSLSDLVRRHRNSTLNRFLLKTSFHSLLTFIYFCYLLFFWSLSPATSSFSWYWSCLVCSGLAYAIYSVGGPSIYVCCLVCYHVIVAPCIRSVGHIFACLYALDDDSELPMDYETSLLPKGFPSYLMRTEMTISCSLCTLSDNVT